MHTKTQATAQKPTVAQVRAHCKNLGVRFRRIADTGEYYVAGYFTDDGQDAMDTATHIARNPAQTVRQLLTCKILGHEHI